MTYLNIARIKNVLRQFEQNFMEDYNPDVSIETVIDLLSDLKDAFEKEVINQNETNKSTLKYYFDSFTVKNLNEPFIGEIFTKETIDRIFGETEIDCNLILENKFKKKFSRHIHSILAQITPKNESDGY